MRNLIIIDIDSERKNPIVFGKGPDFIQPTTFEDAKHLIITDINCLCESLYSMIHNADQNNYGTKKELVDKCIIHLHSMLTPEEPKTIKNEQ